MTLTKKEFLAAVKLCTDAAVQRGHPNMRVKAIKGHLKANNNQAIKVVLIFFAASSYCVNTFLCKPCC